MDNNGLTEESITNAVICSLSPTATHQQRIEAYKLCELFKAEAIQNCQLLYRLLDQARDSRVRHYALLVIEHIIKHCWNHIPTDSKFRLKSLCLDSIKQILATDSAFISDGVAKCTVEIVKREWPQQWPTFIEEMSNICAQNEPQRTELVMRILLRLAEDVVVLNTLKPQRRKDIQTALNSAVITVVPFLVQTLEANIQLYKLGGYPAEGHLLQLIRTTLQTIMGYVGWCDASLVNCHNNKLITLLFSNLDAVHIQLPCVECLLVIAQRHGNTDSISPILAMFYDLSLHSLHQVFVQAEVSCLQLPTHNFLKRLTQFTVAMGEQLCTLLAKEGIQSGLPESFIQYIRILLLLTKHDSLFISSECFEFWATLLRLNTEHQFKSQAMSELSKLCLQKLQKVGSPASDAHPSSHYSKLDFDSEADWLFSYHKNKSSICTVIQLMETFAERELIDMITEEIVRLYHLSLQPGANVHLSDENSILYIQWQAANAFIHAVTKDMTLTSHPSCLSTLQLLLQAPSIEDCVLLELVLSVLSALFPAVEHLLPPLFDCLLEKIFAGVQYSHPTTAPEKCKNLARHAGVIFIRLATLYPSKLTPKFNTLHDCVLHSREVVDNRTFRYLLEGLLIISNEMKNYSRQIEYIRLIMDNSLKKWNEQELQGALCGPIEMSSYIGLLSAPDSDPLYNERRYQLQLLLRDFLIVARRVTTPVDIQVASANGYTDQNGIIQSPAVTVLFPYLDSILKCLSSTMALYRAVITSQFHSGYPPSTILDLPDCERAQVTGLVMVEERSVYDGRKQTINKHVLDILDSINQLLVMLSKLSPEQFYSSERAEFLSQLIVQNINEINSFTLKNCMKSLLKPLCTNCPPELSDIFVSPLLLTTLPHIVNRLDSSWQQVKSLPESEEGEDKPEREIIENELLRITSRVVLDLCVSLCIESADHKSKQKGSQQQCSGDDIEMADPTDSLAVVAANDAEVTTFVRGLAQDETLYLLWLSTNCCCWADSMVSQKSIDLVVPLTKYLMSAGAVTADIAGQVLRSLLTSVHIHGQHDYVSVKLISAIVSVYELLRPQFTEQMVGILLQVPGVTQPKLEQYEHEAGIAVRTNCAAPKTAASAKKKRDKLKALISAVVGRNISEEFKEQVVIKNLPPLVKRRLRKSDITETDTTGLCELFDPR